MPVNLRYFFEKKARVGSIVVGSVLIGIIGYVDTVTSSEVSFAILYLVAICYITWFAGRLPGAVASIASALICFFDEYTGAGPAENLIFAYWNVGGILGIFLIVSYLLSELQKTMKRK